MNLRKHFHRTGSNWNHGILAMDEPHVSIGLLGIVPFVTANQFQLGFLLN